MRSASLSNNYKEALAILDDIDQLIDGLSDQKEPDLALKGFMLHNASITLGYLGKKNDPRHNTYQKAALDIYSRLNARYDSFILSTQLTDIDIYYTEYGYHDQISSYKKIMEDYSEYLSSPPNLYFKIGIVYLLSHLRKPVINNIYDNSYLIIAKEQFLMACKITGYKEIWSKCALLICKHHLREEIDRNIFDDTIDSYKSKALRFPIICYLFINANRILGNQKKVNSLYFEVERVIDKLINIFPNDSQYRSFIIQNYTIIIEDWILDTPKTKPNNVINRFKHIIHANEIIQNRYLTESLTGTYTNNDNIIYISKLINKIILDNKGIGLLYITTILRQLSSKPIFYLLFARDLSDENTYEIHEIESDKLFDFEMKFHSEFRNANAQMETQLSILEDYASILHLSSSDFEGGEFLVIPNNISLRIPIHMAFNTSEFLYEKASFNYFPNLHLANREKPDTIEINITVFYNSNSENSFKEANMILDILGKDVVTIIPDPTINDIKCLSKGTSIVHIVTHQKNGKIIFNDHNINTTEFVNVFPENLELVVLNICKGGEIMEKSDYPIDHKGLVHGLLEKNVKKIITNSWDLGQEASYDFSKAFYNNFMITKNLNRFPLVLKNRTPLEYGGYMIWGN